MVAGLIGEIMISVFGEAVAEYLPFKPEPRPPEGEWNASLGMVSFFLSGLAAIFSVGVAFALHDPSDFGGPGGRIFALALCGGLAFVGLRLGQRAMLVTARRRSLSRLAMWLAIVTLILCAGGSLWNLFQYGATYLRPAA